ncbi:3D domain-containing protein [Desulfitobacterium sp.]|uniref:3D domain-containing protein n=1 Tax=Desulfitobacterium sp. TaxID=49981 RepID=UPI002B1FDE0F|nr:3D domain-containing protein [Desulfitobacterium sp.]MEA4900222.1 3D domain-containing protein [Desulfitobacterium sp.]
MYSLPIANYMDYWRIAKNRSVYIGSGLLIAGTTLVYLPMDKVMENLPQRTVPLFQSAPAPATTIPSSAKEVLPRDAAIEQAASEQALPEAVAQVHTEFRIIDVEVPVETEYEESNQLSPGTTKVKDEGKKGVERQVIKITQVNGEITSEKITHQFMLEAPKKRVVLRNTKPIAAVKPESKSEADVSQLNIRKVMVMEATAYTYTGNKTATGIEPREGIIAVDPRVIPLGTQVYVEGYGYAVAADTGGLIKGNIIDVFFPSFQRCINWGRRPVKVYVINA